MTIYIYIYIYIYIIHILYFSSNLVLFQVAIEIQIIKKNETHSRAEHLK